MLRPHELEVKDPRGVNLTHILCANQTLISKFILARAEREVKAAADQRKFIDQTSLRETPFAQRRLQHIDRTVAP
jgi:hypothetical protein